MTKLGHWINQRQLNEVQLDKMIFGTGIYILHYRYPFNPLRWILGEVKIKRLDPRGVIIK